MRVVPLFQPPRHEFIEFVRGGLGLSMWDVPESELLQLLGPKLGVAAKVDGTMRRLWDFSTC